MSEWTRGAAPRRILVWAVLAGIGIGARAQGGPPAPAVPTAPAVSALAEGDAAWQRRAEGHHGAVAAAGPIDEAVAAYERALAAQPERPETAWKLLRALHFKGEFVARDRERKQAVFGHGREVAEAALDRLGQRVGGRAKLDAMSPSEVAKAYAGVPEAVALHLWGGIHWALWGDVFGRIAAARQGVGDRIRRYCAVVNAIDERYAAAGGHRLLGRLHTLAPRIPFVTGWVDRGTAVAELRRAVLLAPEDFNNQLFLADALLQFQREHAAEARDMLRRLIARPPRPESLVEDEDSLAKARKLLADQGS